MTRCDTDGAAPDDSMTPDPAVIRTGERTIALIHLAYLFACDGLWESAGSVVEQVAG